MALASESGSRFASDELDLDFAQAIDMTVQQARALDTVCPYV
ncbi:hypothetical protein LMG28688_05194 [Paraburkholderia caffeinitolerans]|uniref:Uncharacterized protein n=1 Tax=Paraburkholderia caffeinitolerans TaxID=1723730 RepID=A0A6J5GKN1_9BURK|nr:hypothetical protein LMG28688_05194 [Paraburkholderia caffeinitolerans]